MKVFLSSTALDLTAYRQIADDTILRLSHQTVAMERFGPLPGMPVDECERLAQESDVVVCIVAHRYGFVPDKGKGSITRREVEAAHKAGKDVLVWIVDDSFPWTDKKEQDLLADPNVVDDPARVEEVREGVAGVIDFKAWLRKTFTPEPFTTPNDLGRKIAITLSAFVRGHSATSLPQERISISRLPTSGAELFGREAELKILDDAWANPNTNIVSFVAWGGVGKTALVNHWLKKRMARDNYRGAERVYGWSFFSQGTSERAASADLFIDQALRWFGDKDPTAGSPWDKGERLAGYLRQTRTLLLLDGLEPLQHPPGPQEGKLKDAAMQALLVELAAQQPGLCVISTRQGVSDLVEFEGATVVKDDLDQLSPQAGAQILLSLNVRGDGDELEEASCELDGHAFSLTLLGSYLDEVLNGNIRRRNEIENLFEDTRYGDLAQRMIAAYEKWLGERMELSILRLLGFFDRPADAASIGALCEEPSIPGLTESLQHFKGREWNQAVAKLRRMKLLADATPNEPDTLDAHPLLREHFKQRLKRECADAWREGNNRLYEHLKNTTKEFPNTMEQMFPLFFAVTHGCAAGRSKEVLDEIYLRRIQRGDKYFVLYQLGAFGADLAAVSGFFDNPWELPRAEFSAIDKALVLSIAGYDLRASGRMQEAVKVLQAAIKLDIEQADWRSAAIDVGNLAEIHLTMGNLSQALNLAEESEKLADRGGDLHQRMNRRVTSAQVLHQRGQIEAASAAFREAEAMHKQEDPEKTLLYSRRGYLYCDLLLDKGLVAQVKDRLSKTLAWPKPGNRVLGSALEHLVLARALLIEAQQGGPIDVSEVSDLVKLSVDGLRASFDSLPLGLLARVVLHRFNCNYDAAQHDLAEVYRIATRGGMNLYLADYHLESARLRLSLKDKEKAREHWVTAKKMIDEMGYHRRDKEVEEIQKQLA